MIPIGKVQRFWYLLSMNDFPIAVTCFRGLADLLLAEVREAGYGDAGIINPELVLVPSGDAAVLAKRLRIARRILRLFVAGDVSSIDELVALAEVCGYEHMISNEKSFGVRCDRLGHHPFTSEDIERVLGSCIRRRFTNSGLPVPPVDLENPVQFVVASVRDKNFYVGLDLLGYLDRRLERPYQPYAPLNPTIAAAMLRLGNFLEQGAVLDPMAGSGTIVVEAAELAERAQRACSIAAAEQYEEPLAGLRQNLDAFGRTSAVTTHLGDAEKLGYIEKGAYPLIVTNPPYGIRIGAAEGIDVLYRRFAHAARERGVNTVVSLTTRKRSWAESMEEAGFHLIEVRSVLYGRLTTWMSVYRATKP